MINGMWRLTIHPKRLQGLLLPLLEAHRVCRGRPRLKQTALATLPPREDKACRQDFRSFAIPLLMLRRTHLFSSFFHGSPPEMSRKNSEKKSRFGGQNVISRCCSGSVTLRSRDLLARKPKFEQPIFGLDPRHEEITQPRSQLLGWIYKATPRD